MYPIYTADILDAQGNILDQIDDIISLQAARAFNVDGSATLVIPDYHKRDYFNMHTRMILWRYDHSGRPLNFGDTVWFLKSRDRFRDEKTYTLKFVDAFAMLGTRIVAYTSLTPYADKTLEELGLITYNNDLRTDNMMRAYMRENFGDEALDATRLNASVSIERDKNLGPYGEKQAAWQEIDSALSDLARQSSANGLNIFYDLLPASNGTFLFRVWTKVRGIDRSSGAAVNIVLNDTDGMLADIHEVEDWSEVATVCYALGYDSGPSQVIETVTSPLLLRNDPFSRIEMTVNASDSDVSSVLRAAAQQALNGRRPKRLVTARVVENNALRYGDILYGDALSIEVGGYKYDVAINAVSVQWDSAGEELEMRLSGEAALGPLLSGGPPDPGVPNPVEVNTPPAVDAGDDQVAEAGAPIALVGSAVDDGLPNPPGVLTYLWTKVSGPGTATFDDATDPTTNVTVDTPGVYVLRLTASDSVLNGSDDITITADLEPTVPPDFGLIGGVEDVAGISADGFLYVTADFQTVSGSGGPTWTETDLGTGFLYSFVVDPFSPGYINNDGTGTIDGWVVDDTDIYRVTDLFGTPVATSVHTFAVATAQASFHWRTIQASFGRYFVVDAENPWLLCVSYYGDTSGHEGTWATFSMDAGVTWSTEVQIAADYLDIAPDHFSPIGVYTSPKTPGLAYTVARSPDDLTGQPTWVSFDNANVLTNEGPSVLKTWHVEAVDPGPGGGVTVTNTMCVAPPVGTSRILITANWQVVTVRGGAGSLSGSFVASSPGANVDDTDDLSFSIPPNVGAGGTTSGSFTFEATLQSPLTNNWPATDVEVGTPTADQATEYGTRFVIIVSANGTTLTSITVDVDFRIREVELEDGTIYTFAPGDSVGQLSEDWGATWTPTSFIEAGSAMAGSIHLPWPANDDEDLAYYGNLLVDGGARIFSLAQNAGGVLTDISPVESGVSYGVNRYGFAVRSFDSDRQYLVLSGVGNNVSEDFNDDEHAVFVSDDSGATWTMVLGPSPSGDSPDSRPVYEAAFGGNDRNIIFVWGPDGYIGYTSDFGAAIDDRSGNLGALGALGFIGIAGGATGP